MKTNQTLLSLISTETLLGQDSYGNTPLHLAAKEGNEELVKLLLPVSNPLTRNKPTEQDKDGLTACGVAFRNNHGLICIIIQDYI